MHWEMLMDRWLNSEKNSCWLRKALLSWARWQALKRNRNSMTRSRTIQFCIAKKLFLEKMASKIGLDRCRLSLVGASAVKRQILKFYLSLDIPLMESYGMSECGIITVNRKCRFKLGSVGRPIPGMEVKLQEDHETGSNHILMAGRNVFMGYLKDEEKTTEAFDDHGYLRSSDFGILDVNNFLFISGRASELIIKKDSRNVYPSPIEQRILSLMPCLSHCIVVGEMQEFLHVLLVLKTKVDPRSGKPTDILDDLAVEWCRSIGVDAEKLSDICKSKDPKLVAAIQEVIEKTNAGAWSDREWIKNWRIMPAGFSISGGELGVTMKVNRQKVHEKYQKIIKELYEA